ncbi:MAG: hypothetical protein JO353_12740 [Phycisphaerae bacterium]|nr:hypothetical protein [Phycisphaerae bacterium]
MPDASSILAPISAGELIDKITILRIKAQRVSDSAKLQNILHELNLLEEILASAIAPSADLNRLTSELQRVNELLWDVEDDVRLCDRSGEFGPRFIELARSVYRHNDRRSALKRQINELLGSRLIEEKSYRTDGK